MEITQKTEIVLIIAIVLVVSLLAICIYPQSADNVIDFLKTFLPVLTVSASGAVSALIH